MLLQGLEYPIKSNMEIRKFFEENPKKEFILAQNISDCDNKKEIHKYRLYYYLDKEEFSFFKAVVNWFNAGVLLKIGLIPKLKRNYAVDKNGRRLKIHQGCAQFGLTQEAVEYILQFHDINQKFNRYFKTMYAPDESYFHTILYNSQYIKNTPDGVAVTRAHLTDYENLTYFEYPTGAVRLFRKKEEWPILRDSNFLFFRKASSESKELLDYIDELHSQEMER